jgi:hypothetical protein
MERRLLLMHCYRILSNAAAVSQDGEDIGCRGYIQPQGLIREGSGLEKILPMMEIVQVGTEKLEGLGFRQGCCRLLIRLHCVEPVGKKDKLRVSRSVVTESNVTSVLDEERSDASVNSSQSRR